MSGRTGEYNANTGRWSNVIYMPCTAENNFVPELPDETPDIIYLCFPNNPTGSALTRQQLQRWVDYANEKKAVIIFDAAYEAYISEREFHIVFTSARMQKHARLNCAVFQKMPDLPERALHIRLFQKNFCWTA